MIRIPARRFARRTGLAWGALALVLLGCGDVDYHPVMPDAATLSASHMGAYSTQMGDEREVPGTLFQTRWKFIWKKRGDGYLVQRRLDSLFGRGYHKLSMPNELEKKADLDITLGSDGVPVSIHGYDSLLAVLGRIPQKRKEYREQLLRNTDTVRLQALTRDAFRLRKLLAPGVLPRKMALGVGDINQKLETLKLDSAKYQGPRPRLDLSCLEYEAYYHRNDSLPLMVEQFFFSNARHRKWKKATWSPGLVEGTWHFSVERKTGLPCFESITEIGHITLKDSVEKSEQPITLYRYEEDIYNH